MKLKDAYFLEENLWTKARQHIKKQRYYFTNKGPSSQSYDFSVVMYGYESWTIKEAECQRIDAFELWCWRRLLRVLGQQDLISPSPGKLVLIIHWKDWCWSWNSTTLATWCEEPTPWKRPWCWERLKAGEGDGKDESLDSISDSMDINLSRLQGVGDGQGSLACFSPWGHRESDMTEQLIWAKR